jgi:hypothetical protein
MSRDLETQAKNRADMAEYESMLLERTAWTDTELLAELTTLDPLVDEYEPEWDTDAYWEVANRYLALAKLCSDRKLRPAVKLLLERACYGDPNAIMRGLRHYLEAIANPDWSFLADVCLETARSPRLGTRYWAIHELAILDDPRAKPILEQAIIDGPDDIRDRAQAGLDRLAGK